MEEETGTPKLFVIKVLNEQGQPIGFALAERAVFVQKPGEKDTREAGLVWRTLNDLFAAENAIKMEAVAIETEGDGRSLRTRGNIYGMHPR